MFVQLASLNYLAVFVAWVVHIILGLIWFSPGLFGKEWSKLTGKEMKPAINWMVPMLIGHLAMVFVLLILIKLASINNGIGGLAIGLLTWAGFVVPIEMGELVWEKIPFKLFLLRTGNQLIGIAAVGYILGAWQ
jgi:hypothetical protein